MVLVESFTGLYFFGPYLWQMQPIVSKLPGKGTTIFTTMSSLAAEHHAINLGQGFPDFPMDATLTNAVNAAMQKGYNQYAPMAGWLPLREVLAEKINMEHEG